MNAKNLTHLAVDIAGTQIDGPAAQAIMHHNNSFVKKTKKGKVLKVSSSSGAWECWIIMNSLVLAGPWMVLNGLAAVTSDEAPSDSVTDHYNNTCVWVCGSSAGIHHHSYLFGQYYEFTMSCMYAHDAVSLLRHYFSLILCAPCIDCPRTLPEG